MPQNTIPFITVGTAWQNLNEHQNLTALGVENGDQLMVTNRSTFTLLVHNGQTAPGSQDGYDRIKKGETYISVAGNDLYVKGQVGPCSLLVEYAP
jgi:hypothetical protein